MPNPGDNVLSPPNGLSTKTDAQLRLEALKQATALVNLVGGDWYDSRVPPKLFDPADRPAWFPVSCDMNGIAEQYRIFVRQVADPSAEFDPDALSDKVRAYWEGLGYSIRQIGPPSQDTERGRSIIVDLPLKAGLSFSASTQILAISVRSECKKRS